MSQVARIGLRRSDLVPVSQGARDRGGDGHLVVNLLCEALSLLEDDAMAARRCIESACALVRGADHPAVPTNNLLADWQVRRAHAHIRGNLASGLRIESVAKLVNLSASYFSRAFKATVGVSYSKFVARERIELAKRLLLTTERPISEIALMCGLADQSHLTRLFGKSEGLPPRAWRRSFANDFAGDPATSDEGTGLFEREPRPHPAADPPAADRRFP